MKMRYVNSVQTPEERTLKYNHLKLAGATVAQARRWRDWTKSHIQRIALPYLKTVKEKCNLN